MIIFDCRIWFDIQVVLPHPPLSDEAKEQKIHSVAIFN